MENNFKPAWLTPRVLLFLMTIVLISLVHYGTYKINYLSEKIDKKEKMIESLNDTLRVRGNTASTSRVEVNNINLSHIMVQKYIATVLNPETWVDMRRMDYSSAIYHGLQRPENVNLALFPTDNDWIQAMCYEYNEVDRNYENIPTNDPYIRLTTPLWWNTPE